LAAAAEAIAHDPTLREAAADLDLTLEQTVADGPEGTVCWHVVLRNGRARLVDGPVSSADLRFTTTWDVAREIARGDLPAPTAFMDGHLRVGGDLTLLLRHHRKLAAVDDVLSALRSKTSWD
jgi:putative sterol carrier protein